MGQPQQNEDANRTQEIEANKTESLDWRDLTNAQVEERPDRTKEIEEGKKQGGGAL
jgi:hypothetical protein